MGEGSQAQGGTEAPDTEPWGCNREKARGHTKPPDPMLSTPQTAAKRSKARETKRKQVISSASSWLKITSLISLSEITTGLEIHCQ